ncbi:MAG: phospho-sugar mutase [Bacteroidales bacterium]|nr:phospho-sugar mutase [Bacteroidales bacterium]
MDNEKYALALAKANLWLESNIDEETRNEIVQLMNNPDELVEAFYSNLEFGTGGLRGIMGAGTNRMNVYVVEMATQGLCNYLHTAFSDFPKRIAISYDSRNNSKKFAFAAADVFASNDFEVFIFDDIRPTPELSYAVRKLKCVSGIMITASHNPKEYNGYKAYGYDGGQYVSPHDVNIIHEVKKIESINDVKKGKNKENIKILSSDFDEQYLQEILNLSMQPQLIRKHAYISLVYTPLHGTGIKMVPIALQRLGFQNVHIVEEQSIADGNFPTTPSPNPEEREALSMAIEKAKQVNADLVFATDPDADRVGIAVKTFNNEFLLLNGNQTAAILTYYILSQLKEKNELKGNEYIVKTIVTTELLTEIAHSFNVQIYDVLTGFKYIAEIIRNNETQKKYICGGEESYGFLVGDYVRDKDAVSACTMIAEVAAWAKEQSKTLWDVLLDIYRQYGYYKEALISITKKGLSGLEEIKQMMNRYRENAPQYLANSKVILIKDYKTQKQKNILTNTEEPIMLPKSDVLQYFTEDGTVVSIRPSGTEPKIKFYVGMKFVFVEPLAQLEQQANDKLLQIKKDLGL